VIFGHIGDSIGHKRVLKVSVVMVGLATFAIGILPIYEQIGVAAPALLIAIRIFQGLSVGGEYSGSVTFVVGHSPPNRRAFLTSWMGIGSFLGFIIGAAAGAHLPAVFEESQVDSWAWRLPFLFSIVIAIGGMLVRRTIDDLLAAEEKDEVEGLPIVA
tara:strand:- start:382 stop:855 length:474 start_codon:yes stop_codon:yes gene_type:complete